MNIVKMIGGYIDDFRIKLEIATETIEAENELASVSSFDFVFVFKSVAENLSRYTGKPYMDYLEEAKQMILSGTGLSDVLYHFDMLLYDAEEGEKHE